MHEHATSALRDIDRIADNACAMQCAESARRSIATPWSESSPRILIVRSVIARGRAAV
jgi:hypothetical protein